MRFLLAGLAVISLLLTSCASQHYHYQSESNPQKWEGHNISEVQQHWGSADQVLHARNGNSYYLYTTTSGNSFFNSTSTNFSLSSYNMFPMRGQSGMKCSALFETNAKGVITSTSHAGNNCGGEWAPNKKQS
ncbi:MAG: hypothetical protein V4501_08380 [Pseudomonadota bacterium]